MKKQYTIILIILILIGYYIYDINRVKPYSKDLFYMDTYINVKIYSKSKKDVDTAFSNIEKIYSKYQDMTDVYNENSTLYNINNNISNEEYIDIPSDLYNMIELSNKFNELSNNKFDINMGNVIKTWKKYRDKGEGIPTLEELTNAKNTTNPLIIKDGMILNNNPSIDLGAVVKGYATNEAASYLENNGIKNYIINAGGNVEVGKAYNKEYFSIGIENPNDTSNIYQVVKGNNISIVTSGGYERFYEWDGKKYHHIIDPDTLYPANNMQSVTVISTKGEVADILSTVLFLLPVEDGVNLINSIDYAEAIFYIDENNIIKSEGFSNYE